MNAEEKTGREIARLLNHSLNDISPNVLHQIQSMRRAAVANYQPARKSFHAEADVLARGGYHWFSTHISRVLLSVTLLLVLVTYPYWENSHDIEDKTDTSTVIFIDDSPSEIYDADNTGDSDEAADSSDVNGTWENSGAGNSENSSDDENRDDPGNDSSPDNQSST